MSNTWKTLYGNLSKGQRVGLLILSQFVVVIMIVLILQPVFREREHVEIQDGNAVSVGVPDEVWENFEETLWQVISSNVNDVERNVIDDIVVRDGSYEEIVKGGAKSANFIVDIDSIQQTYVVSIGWSDNVALYGPNNVSIECPPRDQMKYPDTICYGMYNNIYSLDLYLPYAVYPEGHDEDDVEPTAPNYIIHGDEDDKTIDIEVSVCNAEKYHQEALEYLDSLPFSIKDYKINYRINEVDVDCQI